MRKKLCAASAMSFWGGQLLFEIKTYIPSSNYLIRGQGAPNACGVQPERVPGASVTSPVQAASSPSGRGRTPGPSGPHSTFGARCVGGGRVSWTRRDTFILRLSQQGPTQGTARAQVAIGQRLWLQRTTLSNGRFSLGFTSKPSRQC